MNDPNIIYHLFSNFPINWKIDNLLNNFIEDQINPINQRLPYSHPSKKAHWQIFRSGNNGISFARNFHHQFKDECIDVIKQLQLIQKNISTNECVLLKKFLEEKFIFSKVNIIRVKPNVKGELHSDITRNITLNIGLKNSNSHITYVGNSIDIKNFETGSKSKYILNDGEGYLVNVKHPHCLEPMFNTDQPRYIITYTLI